jgi:hypothetical protein
MNTFLKLIICIIFVLASSHHVYANEIASITAIRKATKLQIFENGSYKNLDYSNNYLDVIEDLFDTSIGREALLAKNEIVPWIEISTGCKMPEKKEILRKIDFLNPALNIENLVGEMAKEIYRIKSQLIICGVKNVIFNVIEENYLISSTSVARKQMRIFSYGIDYSGGIMKNTLNLKSYFQSPEYEISSGSQFDFKYTKEIEYHSKKLFKQLNP